MNIYKAQRIKMHFIPAAGSSELSEGDREIVKILDGDLKGCFAIIKWGTGQKPKDGKRYVKTELSSDLFEILFITIGKSKMHLMK